MRGTRTDIINMINVARKRKWEIDLGLVNAKIQRLEKERDAAIEVKRLEIKAKALEYAKSFTPEVHAHVDIKGHEVRTHFSCNSYPTYKVSEEDMAELAAIEAPFKEQLSAAQFERAAVHDYHRNMVNNDNFGQLLLKEPEIKAKVEELAAMIKTLDLEALMAKV